MIVCDTVVLRYAEGRVYRDVVAIQPCEFGLLLGATPQTRIGSRTNMFFKYSIDAAEALCKARKVRYILISGDDDSLDGVNEVECMKNALVARGVPEHAIILDGKGLRTLDSVVRANKIFGLNTFTVISQQFHNERALYLAEHLGLEIEGVQGFNAQDCTATGLSVLTYIREYFARVKMMLDILTYKSDESDCSMHPLNNVFV